jgi:hypothetical protein
MACAPAKAVLADLQNFIDDAAIKVRHKTGTDARIFVRAEVPGQNWSSGSTATILRPGARLQHMDTRDGAGATPRR